jgi:transposase
VLDGLRGEHSIAALWRREGITEGLYDRVPGSWQARLAGDTARAATSREVRDLRRQARS